MKGFAVRPAFVPSPMCATQIATQSRRALLQWHDVIAVLVVQRLLPLQLSRLLLPSVVLVTKHCWGWGAGHDAIM